jgi:hypothetical protein
MIPRVVWCLLPLLLLTVPSAAATGGHYIPNTGDRFDYFESVSLGDGTGNYTGYTEQTYVNGTVGVTGVASNGTESATYSNTNSWMNNQGQSDNWASSGAFTFSADSYHYVQGTDNQTGYTNPYVWFYTNSSSPAGATFTILNSPMRVVSRDVSYALGSPLNENVVTIFAEGNGSYERNDDYGFFTATYNWMTYYDPTTGYVVGYLYTEQDSDGAPGDGFTITDLLYVTSTTYALTPGSAPPPSGSSGSSGISTNLVIALIVVFVVVLILILVWAVARAHRRSPLPRHSTSGSVNFGPPSAMTPGGAPPPIRLTPSGQPAVQQVVIRETVKVNCRYCGALIDTTAASCPNCGAPRT